MNWQNLCGRAFAAGALNPADVAPDLGSGIRPIGGSDNHLVHADLQITDGKNPRMGRAIHRIRHQIAALIFQLDALEIVGVVL